MTRAFDRLKVRVEAEVRVDLPALIRRDSRGYAAVSLEGYDEWMRPWLFLLDRIEDGGANVGDVDIVDIRDDWTKADLHERVVTRAERDRQPGPHDVPLPLGEA